jgi:hypothetical protein
MPKKMTYKKMNEFSCSDLKKLHEKIEVKFAFILLSQGFNCFFTGVSGIILSIVFFEYLLHAGIRVDVAENTYQECVAISVGCNTCVATHVLHGYLY